MVNSHAIPIKLREGKNAAVFFRYPLYYKYFIFLSSLRNEFLTHFLMRSFFALAFIFSFGQSPVSVVQLPEGLLFKVPFMV